MKIKITLIVVFSILITITGYSQKSDKSKMEKVKLKKTIIDQDSLLSTYPLLASFRAEKEVTLNGTGKAKKIVEDNSVSLYPVPEKGIIYLKLNKLPKDYKPILEFNNSGGSTIKKIYVRDKVSTINLKRIPSGIYTITLDMNEELLSWQIEKE